MVSLRGARRKYSPIGLDIGSSGVRAAQLVLRGATGDADSAGYVVTASAATAAADSEIRDVPATASERDHIQRCLDLVEFQGRTVCAALSASALEFYPLELPDGVIPGESGSRKGQRSDLDHLVRWEIARLRQEPVGSDRAGPENLETRYWQLPRTHVAAPNVIGVAVPSRTVVRVLDMCSAAALDCTRIDAGAAAVARLGALLYDWSDEHVWGLLDLAREEARVVLCVDNVPVLVRKVGSGGHAWTQRIAECLQLSFRSAEVHKREHGLNPGKRGIRQDAPSTVASSSSIPRCEVASIVFAALRGELKDMASQIKRSYEYVLSCYPKRRAGDLVLIGGGASMRNLPEFLSEALGISVRCASDYLQEPTCRLTFSTAGHAPLETLALAIGSTVGWSRSHARPRMEERR